MYPEVPGRKQKGEEKARRHGSKLFGPRLKSAVAGAHRANICTPSLVPITLAGSSRRLRSLHHNNVLCCRTSGLVKGGSCARRKPQLQ